jgi:hypothetical protein
LGSPPFASFISSSEFATRCPRFRGLFFGVEGLWFVRRRPLGGREPGTERAGEGGPAIRRPGGGSQVRGLVLTAAARAAAANGRRAGPPLPRAQWRAEGQVLVPSRPDQQPQARTGRTTGRIFAATAETWRSHSGSLASGQTLNRGGAELTEATVRTTNRRRTQRAMRKQWGRGQPPAIRASAGTDGEVAYRPGQLLLRATIGAQRRWPPARLWRG